MKIGALVPARAGSKRLPQKNIKVLGGKPLLCWTIDVLLEADVFSDVSVSTESALVDEVVRDHYPESQVAVVKRPQSLSEDDASLDGVVDHYLSQRPDIEWYGLFLPTYPFRRKSKIIDAVNHVYTGYPWKVLSIIEDEFCSMDFYYPCKSGVMRFFRRPPFYASSNLSCYIFRPVSHYDKRWEECGLTNTERIFKLHIDRREAIDIDTPEDFALAEKIIGGAGVVPRKLVQHYLKDWVITLPEEVNLSCFIDFVGKDKFNITEEPILILETARPGFSFFRSYDGNVRSYWVGRQAYEYMDTAQAKRTGNMSYVPLHFQHSRSYRILRKPAVNDQRDAMGIIYGSSIDSEEIGAISMDRVIFSEGIAESGFPVEYLTTVKE